MRLLLTGTHADFATLPRVYVGGLLTPARYRPGAAFAALQLPWAVDNGAYSDWQPRRWWACLVANRATPGCWWAAVPDVVGDHAATGRRWHGWAWFVAALGYRPAFVGQDGCPPGGIPRHAGAFFVGGSTAWKLGPAALQCVRAAQARRLRVHMGRVNTRRRLLYAAALGVDSVDGLTFNRFSRADLAWGLRYCAVRPGTFPGWLEEVA